MHFSSSINSSIYMQENSVLHYGKYSIDDPTRNAFGSNFRKEKSNSIFSFLQRLRVKNKNIFENVASLPSSPRSKRFPNEIDNRWESVESGLSSATATSFAFIPSYQFRINQKSKQIPSLNFENELLQSSRDSFTERDNSVYLRKKYNLLGSDVALSQNNGELTINRKLKTLHRNSIGNAQNLTQEFESGKRPAKRYGSTNRRPKSEYDICDTFDKARKLHCHKPGKRKAPPPPIENPNVSNSKVLIKHTVSRRKKRKAPSPPKNFSKMEKSYETEMNVTTTTTSEERTMCNDSLKLEKGVLKANNNTSTVIAKSVVNSEMTNVPVSPKPWYKRSATRTQSKTIKNSDKKKGCEQVWDERMLEVGLPRSSAMFDEHKVVSLPSKIDENEKRRSQISMLANISELDREAAEIVQKERDRERDTANSINDQFYQQTCDTFPSSVDRSNMSKRHTSKDLISILNAITNVTKITVNNSFFKEDPAAKIITKESATVNKDPKSSYNNKTLDVDGKSKLTITELENVNDENVTSKQTNVETKTVFSKNVEEPMKPIKPFSSWICPQCTLENPSWKFICGVCDKWRPYSASKSSGSATATITPMEDLKLKPNNIDIRKSLGEERNISKMSQHIRKQVYDMLTSNESVKNNWSMSGLNSTDKETRKGIDRFGFARFKSEKSDIELVDEQNIEEIRKARLMFFTKNNLNDLTINRTALKTKSMKVKTAEQENEYYNEEDRKKLRKILKELKNSLSKNENLKPASCSIDRLKSGQNDISNVINVDNNEKTIANKQKENENRKSYSQKTKTIFDDDMKPNAILKITKAKNHETELKNLLITRDNVRTYVYEEINKINRKLQQIIECEKVTNQRKKESNIGNESPGISEHTAESKNIFDYRSEVINAKENKNVTTTVVNRLLKKLQTAIASGQHHEAANIARELARLKVNCNMTRLDIFENSEPFLFEKVPKTSLNVEINDKISVREPFAIKISANSATKLPIISKNIAQSQQSTLEEKPILDDNTELNMSQENKKTFSSTTNKFLKEENLTFKNPNANNQTEEVKFNEMKTDEKNILKNEDVRANLDVKDDVDATHSNVDIETGTKMENTIINEEWQCPRCTLINECFEKNCAACGRRYDIKIIPSINSNFSQELKTSTERELPKRTRTNYQTLVDLEKNDLITNTEQFECSICLIKYHFGEGVVLKECLHTFCRECLSLTIQYSEEAEVKCPYRDVNYSCESALQEREIKALVSAELFDKYLAKSVSQAENKIQNAFHCKTVDCTGWCIFEDNVNEFHCPVCFKINCLTCQTIHSGLNCKQYQEMFNKESETNVDANTTRHMLQEMLQKGEAMTCPTCFVILMKKWGCDWLRCTMCKTEICWVTRGPRWGPQGKGDTSGGCRCGINGVKCHQKCTFCH